jgi:hypothetical protein
VRGEESLRGNQEIGHSLQRVNSGKGAGPDENRRLCIQIEEIA